MPASIIICIGNVRLQVAIVAKVASFKIGKKRTFKQ